MKIIALEGLDKSGKFNQSILLAERLQADGYKVAKSEFHRYDTPTGKIIFDWLTGRYETDQKTIELIMTADKQAQQSYFQELEQEGFDYLILDRYTLSQIVYSKSSGISIEWTNTLQQYIRKPDADIIIDIPAEVSMSRKGKHNNGENDRYEANLEFLNMVRNNYITTITRSSAALRYVVDGIGTIDEIHEKIYEFVCDNLIHNV